MFLVFFPSIFWVFPLKTITSIHPIRVRYYHAEGGWVYKIHYPKTKAYGSKCVFFDLEPTWILPSNDWIIELSITSLKEGWNRGFHHSLTKLYTKSLSCIIACFESWLKFLGWILVILKTGDNLKISIGYAHGTHFPKSQVGSCKANLAYPFMYEDELKNQFVIKRHHSLCMVI